MFSKVLTALFVCAGISLMAAAPRLDISAAGKTKIKPASQIEGGYCYNPPWWNDKKDFHISSQGAALKDGEWTDFEVSFIPETDGKVTIILMGNYLKGKDKKMVEDWVCWDDVVIEGADVINGDFEKGSADKPANWSVGKGQYISKDGKKYIKVWHNKRASQTISVKAGQKVTIKAKVKKADAEDIAAGSTK